MPKLLKETTAEWLRRQIGKPPQPAATRRDRGPRDLAGGPVTFFKRAVSIIRSAFGLANYERAEQKTRIHPTQGVDNPQIPTGFLVNRGTTAIESMIDVYDDDDPENIIAQSYFVFGNGLLGIYAITEDQKISETDFGTPDPLPKQQRQVYICPKKGPVWEGQTGVWDNTDRANVIMRFMDENNVGNLVFTPMAANVLFMHERHAAFDNENVGMHVNIPIITEAVPVDKWRGIVVRVASDFRDNTFSPDGEKRVGIAVEGCDFDTWFGDYRVNGTKVVGGQQAAIANADGNNNTTTINNILSAMRSHGLIATE